jgi:hypothetical protein
LIHIRCHFALPFRPAFALLYSFFCFTAFYKLRLLSQDASGEAAAEAQKHLTLYELDLGLNHVMRKHSEPIDNGANLLVAVPGEADGPGGVLVCCENFILWKAEGQAEVRAVIPRRSDLPADRGVLIVAHATHRQKNMFFFLVQASPPRHDYSRFLRAVLRMPSTSNEFIYCGSAHSVSIRYIFVMLWCIILF